MSGSPLRAFLPLALASITLDPSVLAQQVDWEQPSPVTTPSGRTQFGFA